jgi:hypothetical protein
MGRLSNPPPVVETLAEQGSQASHRSRQALGTAPNRVAKGSSVAFPEEKGRLSNPVQRRLTEAAVDDVVGAYLVGSSIDSLAAQLGVNRTTIIHHLDRRRIERRNVVRKMTDRIVQRAATRYRHGESLKVVAAQFDVDATTLAREFRRAGVPIRPRRGWPPST